MQSTIRNRTVFGRDNLEVIKGINSDSIDLIYLDPPFNKNKVFIAPIGSASEGASFSDIFRKEDLKDEWFLSIYEDNPSLYELLDFARKSEGKESYNYCYLAYMSIRLIEMHRILKDTGSLYLHCDPTMSHYLKLALDCIFGEKNFRNEIIWCYKSPNNVTRHYPRKHDCIYFYAKSENAKFNRDIVRVPYQKERKPATWIVGDEVKRVPQNKKGTLCLDWWIDIPSFSTASGSKERTGYPTQKPLKLLERIIQASTKKGDVVLDPFCGCATTCIAAEKLGRQWIGIDVSVKAYELVKKRLDKEVDWEDSLFHEELVTYLQIVPERTDQGKESQLTKYVYVISHKNYKNEFKVGIATNPESRLGTYQTGDPNRLYCIEFKLRTAKFREIEEYIHKQFKNRHEWVQGNLEDITKAIKKANRLELEKLHEDIEKFSGQS